MLKDDELERSDPCPNGSAFFPRDRHPLYGTAWAFETQPKNLKPMTVEDMFFHFARGNGVCANRNCRTEIDFAAKDGRYRAYMGRIDHYVNHGGMRGGKDADNFGGFYCFMCSQKGAV